MMGNVKSFMKKERRYETTEIHHRGHREKEFRFFKSSVNSVVASQKEYAYKKTNTLRAQRGVGKRLSHNLFILKSFLSVLCGYFLPI